MKKRLLDLFCCAGGCSKGYSNAGYEVVGVDIAPQPHYPFPFIQADALSFLVNEDISNFDIIHASPPCHAYSQSTIEARMNGVEYPDLLGITREKLQRTGKPWIIENVIGAPVHSGIVLCGSMFGLQVRRHRYFETSHLIFAPGPCKHNQDFVSVFGGDIIRQKSNPNYRGKGSGVASKIATSFPLEKGQVAMGIDWMDRHELSQAIPPAYTEWVGKQMLPFL